MQENRHFFIGKDLSNIFILLALFTLGLPFCYTRYFNKIIRSKKLILSIVFHMIMMTPKKYNGVIMMTISRKRTYAIIYVHIMLLDFFLKPYVCFFAAPFFLLFKTQVDLFRLLIILLPYYYTVKAHYLFIFFFFIFIFLMIFKYIYLSITKEFMN